MVKGFVLGLMKQQTVGRHVNGIVVSVTYYHGEANCRERTVFLLCLIVTVSLAIDTVLCPVDVVLAQVTIIPGTGDDNIEDDIEDEGDESEEIPDGVIEDETTSSSGEIAGAPFQSSFAGKITGNPQITQSVNYSHFIPLTNSPGDQLKIIVDYNVVDPSIDNQSINAVMEVFSLSNQSLIKTSSFPNPILANTSGTVQLATSFPDNAVTEVVSLITFTDAEKGFALSEPLTLTMKLGEPSTTPISG